MAPLGKEILIALLERLPLPPDLRQKGLRLLTGAGSEASPNFLEAAVDAVASVAVEARTRFEASARDAERFLTDLEKEHGQLSQRVQALVPLVRQALSSIETFGQTVRAETDGIRLTVDEMLEGPSSLKRAISLGVQGVLGALEAQEAEEQERGADLERELARLDSELSELQRAVAERVKELRARVSAPVDELTGCPDRLGCLDRIEAEAVKARSSGTPLALLFLRIDGLAATHERFGFEAGDEVVRVIAKIAAKGVEPAGFLGRHGVGEFLAVLPGADLAGAAACGEEIREAVAMFRFLSKGERFPISISVGAAEFRADDPPHSFLQRAYRASGLAQERGGNLVVTSGSE
jgi:diguanylate cyclase (GGDEF)-like protein